MQRPTMNPMSEQPARKARWPRVFKRVTKVLMTPPLGMHLETDGTLARRLLRGLLYRLALLPLVLILGSALLVYFRTHPAQPAIGPDPLSEGVYFEPINLMSDDRVRLEGWLAPALDARQVIANGEKTLEQRWPAVVLVHGFGMPLQQVLPLFRPLHDDGFVVLAVACRGTGTSAAVGQTLGLNEAMDVAAAVQSLRRRPYVDGNRIAIVGIGSGANAALLNADRDSALAALVLDDPADTGDQAVSRHIASNTGMLAWLDPLCQWMFAIGYGLDVRDLDLSQYGRTMASRPTLLMRWSADSEADLSPQSVDQIVSFLDNAMDPPKQQADTE